jgi:hypothetical protein
MPYDMKVARCQCDPNCKNPPEGENSPFCKEHAKQCKRQSPLSGSEPDYKPELYNPFKGVLDLINCYDYAANNQYDEKGNPILPKDPKCTREACPLPFVQPGKASGYPSWSKIKGKRCPDVMARVLGDIPGSRISSFEEPCPKGMRKIAFVVDENNDYHVVRQDSNGFWSHKPGSTKVTPYDALQRKIYDPSLASWLYPGSGLHYKQFCGFVLIPATQMYRLKRGGLRSARSIRSARKHSSIRSARKHSSIRSVKQSKHSKRSTRRKRN